MTSFIIRDTLLKHLELGAVIAAAPIENVRRERPMTGDVVILLGGSTGRDGIGGATGSSKAHTSHSPLRPAVQRSRRAMPPEERKLQRLFRNPEASSRMTNAAMTLVQGGCIP